MSFKILIRYYYTNSNFRNEFLQQNENEDKPRDVLFENNMQTMIFINVRIDLYNK
jgi:hypothetical protein